MAESRLYFQYWSQRRALLLLVVECLSLLDDPVEFVGERPVLVALAACQQDDARQCQTAGLPEHVSDAECADGSHAFSGRVAAFGDKVIIFWGKKSLCPGLLSSGVRFFGDTPP